MSNFKNTLNKNEDKSKQSKYEKDAKKNKEN